MDFLLGSLVTLLIIGIIITFLSKFSHIKKQNFRYSQSGIHEIIKPLIPSDLFKRKVITQSSKHEENVNVKVIIMGNNAYWIKDNQFYVADLEDGIIDKDSTRIVDIMDMNQVELDKMLFIMDRLREGLSNDSGNSGN